ncbi:MAG TPA: glycosyltransferase [Gammaproteobacteria bacterium]|nr:glycosyltransferase [Gammaproteobacteria bacterium]
MRAINLWMKGNPYTSYGKIQLALCREFEALGVRVNLRGELDKGGRRWLADNLSEGWVGQHQNGRMAEISLAFYKPQDLINQDGEIGKRLWLLTMSESDKAPSQKWVRSINAHYEQVFVGCDDLVGIYKEAGVTAPVAAIPLGVDFARPLTLPPHLTPPPAPPRNTGRGEYNDRDGHFVWLTHSNGDGRKGAERAIMAFKMAFGGEKRYQLWIKSQYTRNNWLAGMDDEQITIAPGELDEGEWMELLSSVQAFIWLTHGEGFGLTAREATVAGTPTVGTQWLGMKDIDQWGYPVRVERMSPARFIQAEANDPAGMWADADVEQAADIMRRIAGDYESAKMFAIQGRDYLLEHFTYRKMAEAIAERL